MMRRIMTSLGLFICLLLSNCESSNTRNIGTPNIITDDLSEESNRIIADTLFVDQEISTMWSSSGFIVFSWRRNQNMFVDSIYLHEPLEETYDLDHSFIISKKGEDVFRTSYVFLDSNYVMTGVYDGSWNINYFGLSITSDGLVINSYDFFNDKGIMTKGDYFGLLMDPYYMSDTIYVLNMNLIKMTSKTGFHFEESQLESILFGATYYPDLFHGINDESAYSVFESLIDSKTQRRFWFKNQTKD